MASLEEMQNCISFWTDISKYMRKKSHTNWKKKIVFFEQSCTAAELFFGKWCFYHTHQVKFIKSIYFRNTIFTLK